MSKFFNNSSINNNTQAQETQESNKLGWLKTGLLVAGGAAATVGAVIGARIIYEHFTDPVEDLEAITYDDEADEGSGMESEEPTDDSSNQETSFKEVEPESNPETVVFSEVTKEDTSVENVPEGKDNVEPSEKPVDVVIPGTFDPINGYKLPEGRSWKSLVRKEIFEITSDLEDEMNKLDFNGSPFVIRCANSVFDRAESVANISEWERLYLDNLYKDFYAYVGYAMDDIADRYMETHQFEDLALAKALFDEFVKSPLCTFRVGKKLKATLKVLTEEAKVFASEDSNENNQVAIDETIVTEDSPKESSTDAEAETAATVVETTSSSDVTETIATETTKEVSDETNNASAIEEFKEKIAEVKRRVENDPIDARKYFNTDVKCYMFDDNIPASVKDDLKKLEADIKDKIYDNASKRITSGKPVVNKKKGGKRNYKKNGRK